MFSLKALFTFYRGGTVVGGKSGAGVDRFNLRSVVATGEVELLIGKGLELPSVLKPAKP